MITSQPLRRLISVERVIEYSDAVIGIMMTLLVVESIDVLSVLRKASEASSPSPDHVVINWLREQAWRFPAHAVAFFLIAYLWRRHHFIFRNFRDVSRGILWLNAAFLIVIALMPFASVLLATSHFAAASVAFLFGVCALSLATLYLLLRRGIHHHIFQTESTSAIRVVRLYVAGPMWITFAAMLIALVAAFTNSTPILIVSVCSLLVVLAIPVIARRMLIDEPAQLQEAAQPESVPDESIVVAMPNANGPLATFFGGIRTHRTLLFSDGVYAIAITAMALQIGPDGASAVVGNRGVLSSLKDVFDLNLTYGNFWFFALLFVLIQMIWLQHQRLFFFVRKIADRTIWLNNLHLFTVVLLPVVFGIVSAALYTAVIPWWIASIGIIAATGTVLPVGWSNLRYRVIRTVEGDRVWRVTVTETVYLVLLVLIMLAPLGLFRVALVLLLFKDPFVNIMWRQANQNPRERRTVREVLFDTPIMVIGSKINGLGVAITAGVVAVSIVISYFGNGIELMTLN